jgi:hypothetical protein
VDIWLLVEPDFGQVLKSTGPNHGSELDSLLAANYLRRQKSMLNQLIVV